MTNDELPRRKYVGWKLSKDGIIKDIIPGSPAENAGLRTNDIVQSICGHLLPLSQKSFFNNYEEISINLCRDNKSITICVKPKTMPYEASLVSDTKYKSVLIGEYWNRLIINIPFGKNGSKSLPVIYILPGIDMHSVEAPFRKDFFYRWLAEYFASNGFVSVRIERSGIGDSQAMSGSKNLLFDELFLYHRVIQQHVSEAYTDSRNIYLFGFSMGGVIAPILSLMNPSITGVVACSTISTKFSVYNKKTTLHQLQIANTPVSVIDSYMKDLDTLHNCLFIERKSPAEIICCHPEIENMFDGERIYGRNYLYFIQLECLDLEMIWDKVSCKQILMASKYDKAVNYDDLISLYERSKNAGKEISFLSSKTDHTLHRYLSADGKFGEYDDDILKSLCEKLHNFGGKL